ncbi:AAA family ATPase [Streptomyces sp. NPDC046203]|uniref:ATP-binding protein n=1 Tax=Streptomyces sp. NPDC046203 TaxID=3154602 RepID=UPI0033CD8772
MRVGGLMAPVDHSIAFERLDSIFSESWEGRGQLALIRGGPGCGKTELLRTFMQHAAAMGALSVSATASRVESELQAGLIDQFLRSVELPAGTAKRVDRLISLGMRRERGGSGFGKILQHTAPMVQEVCRILLALSQPRPVVIAVDDVQFADHASLQILFYLARRIRSVRVLIVLTEWDWTQSTTSSLRSELTRCPYHLIDIGPLSDRATADLVTRSLGSETGAELAADVYQLTRGNPLLVKALIEDHKRAEREQGVTRQADRDQSPAVDTGFGEAIIGCLHRWGGPVLDVAQGIAVFGDQSDPELIGRLVNVHRNDAEQAMRTLRAAGLLTDRRLPHPVAETAALSPFDPCERSALHLRAAKLLYQRGAAAIEVARQVIAADQVPDVWATTVLRTAAEQALAGNDVAMAVRCLETALYGAVDKEDRLAITTSLVRALWRVNPSATAPYIPALQAALYDGTLPARDVVSVVRYSVWNGDTSTEESLWRALCGSSYSDDIKLSVELRLAYQWYYGSERGRFGGSKTAIAIGAEPWSRAADHLEAVWNREESDTATDSAERILRSCRLGDSTVEVVAFAVLVLARGDKLERASWWCEQLLEEAQHHGAVVWQMLLGSLRAMISLRRGKVLVAMAQAEEALGLLSAQNWGVMIGCPLATLVSAYTAAGRYDAAAALLRQKVPESMFGTVHGLHYLYARGHYHLATDRVLAAVSDFQQCGRLMQEWSLDIASLVPWRSSLSEAYLKLGRTKVARDLVQQQLKSTRTLDSRVKGISLRVLAACSDLSQRTALLRQAVECLETAGDRIELTRALEELSEVYQQLNEFDRARLLARRAAQESKACHSGAPPMHRPSADHSPEPHQAPPRPPHTEAPDAPVLSDAQRRVAELAALGHTNQEISRRLYITVSTVEQHLTRVFRKLGVQSRNDLPLILSDVS